MRNIKYSETFFSMQGEGHYTGKPSVWLRFFMCNLQCNGFGQKEPTKPDTWILPYETFDVSTVDKITDLPVFETGCDSSYSWSKRYRHLVHDKTVVEVAEELESAMTSEYNTNGKFLNPNSLDHTHLCLTGGEPMMNQQSILDLLNQFLYRTNQPHFITVETNGTKELNSDLYSFIQYYYHTQMRHAEWFWSISPKLFHTSGELNEKALKPEVIKQYWDASKHGQLKFVVNDSPQTWFELGRFVAILRKLDIWFPIYVMPVGATEEAQDKISEFVADEALKRGYSFCCRLQNYIYSNAIGK